MLEREIESEVVSYAESRGCLSIKLNGPHNRGKPDRIFFFAGRTLVIEFKAPGEKPTKLQAGWLSKFRDRGFHAVYHDNIGRGKTEIDKFVTSPQEEEDADLR